jgi:diaminohydroxyphosphoribosylaminopyrimidine deaminase/5-amino-6-(5-phosphoribosylamino)uracil reductase
LRAQHDAIMVGIGTVLADDPHLTVRLTKGGNPLRICLDSNLRIPLSAQVLQDEGKTLIVTTDVRAKDKIEKIRELGKEVLVNQKDADGRVALRPLMKALAKRGIASILVEGGSELITSLLKEDLVKRMVVITAPLILGKGIEAIGDLDISDLGKAIKPSSCELKRMDRDVVFDLSL